MEDIFHDTAHLESNSLLHFYLSPGLSKSALLIKMEHIKPVLLEI